MKFILGVKQGMTQVFREDGTVVPVTKVTAGPCVVTQVKNQTQDKVFAVQIGFGTQKLFRLNKAQQGHLKGIDPVRYMRDVSTNNDEHGLSRGDSYDVNIFEAGEKVQVTGTSKGKGFQGVVKRYNFKGSKATHGNKDQQRMPGSIGATGPARVFKGTRMGGHMGDDQVTVKNLEIVEIHPESNEVYIKGAVPGARGGLIMIYTTEGKIEIKQSEAEVKEEVTHEEAPKEEAPKADAVETAPKVEEKKEVEEVPAEKEESTPKAKEPEVVSTEEKK